MTAGGSGGATADGSNIKKDAAGTGCETFEATGTADGDVCAKQLEAHGWDVADRASSAHKTTGLAPCSLACRGSCNAWLGVGVEAVDKSRGVRAPPKRISGLRSGEMARISSPSTVSLV